AVLAIIFSSTVSSSPILKSLDKGADDYLIKPFSARELITRIRTNIKLSIIRREIYFQRFEQERTKQLLFTISNTILSEVDLNKKFLNVIKEIYNRLPCDRIFIISNEQSESNNKIVALYEDLENITPIINPFLEINYKNKSQTFTKSQEYLNNNSGINISLDEYCDNVNKNASILSIEIILNNGSWGWLKLHRSPNSIWLDSEIELLQQVSNQISLAITYAELIEENAKKEIQIKVAEAANVTKSQILANTSHELRTPLGAIVGILSSFDTNTLSADQRDMITIMARASDIVLSIVNDILDVAKLEAHKVTLINRTFDLLDLLDSKIDEFGKKAGNKNVELIINYETDSLPRYVKSDPERVKFTDQGKIILRISMQSQANDKNKEDPTYNQIVKKENLLIELYDTGIGMDPKYIQHAWKSFSQGDMSLTRRQDGTGLGLSICKNLVEINGGEINAKSQLGKGSKFWFTWNVESLTMTHSLLETQYDEQIGHATRKKRMLIIHPVEDVRNAMLKYLKMIEKVDAFDTFDKGITAAKRYEELHNRPAYNITFIGLYENNKEEVLKAALELRGLGINSKNLEIIFIVFPNYEMNELANKLIEKVGGTTSILYTPITLKKLVNQFMHLEKNDDNNNYKSIYT
ncbi:10710_t:CDS:2, partial [Scutellospora calospora]